MNALSQPAAEASWSRAVEALSGAAEICLACHVRPDADALGSMLAVAHTLCARRHPGRAAPRVVASFGDTPFEVPAILRFLPGTELLTAPQAYPSQPAVMVTFDVSSPDRLGLLAPSAAAAAELIVLDHHASNTGFGSVRLVDPGAAATTQLADELIRRLGQPLTRDIAVNLYAGLVTDTGSFRYSATSAQVHELAARLIDAGVDPGAVAQELWDRVPFGYLGMLAAALGRAVLEPSAAGGRGLVWTAVTRADRAVAGLSMELAEPVIDVLRCTGQAEVAVVAKETDDGRWQVSARSKGALDVAAACAALGGGGHARAAGFTVTGTAAGAVAALRAELGRQAAEPA